MKIAHRTITMEIYCVKCRKKTPTEDITEKKSARGTPMIQGICTVCGTKKTQFIGKGKK